MYTESNTTPTDAVAQNVNSQNCPKCKNGEQLLIHIDKQKDKHTVNIVAKSPFYVGAIVSLFIVILIISW